MGNPTKISNPFSMFFHSEQVHYSAEDGQGEGNRNIVHIKNDKGYKEHANIDANGTTRKRTRHALTRNEIESIEKRKFIPALFRCCRKTRKANNSRKTRKANRVQRKKTN